MNCQKRRVNDQYHCHQCGTQWDIDDQDPPVCQEECDHDCQKERSERE